MAKRRITPRSKMFSFRLTEAEIQSLKIIAEKEGISIGKLIRNKLKLKE